MNDLYYTDLQRTTTINNKKTRCEMRFPKKLLTLGTLLILGTLISVLGFNFQANTNTSLAFNALSTTSNDGTLYDVQYIPIDTVEIFAEESVETLRPSSNIKLSTSLTPYYAIETVQNITYKIINGTNLADIDNNILTVKANATIGGTITVIAIADGKESFNSMTFTVVQTPVESVTITNTEDTIYQGSAFKINTTVEPSNASNQNLKYEIIDGSGYATVSAEGTIRVSKDLPSGNLSITVKVTSVNDSTKSDVKEFALYVPVQEIIIAGEMVTEVEQQQSYSFAAGIYPLHASSGTTLTYSVDVDSSIADISENGSLTISKTAPIGQEITATINGPDNITVTHVLTVKAVYANYLDIVRVSKNDRELSSDNLAVIGDTIVFEIDFPTPFNVTEEYKSFHLEIISGDTEFGIISGNTITIKNGNVLKKNPTFIVRAIYDFNSTVYSEYTVTVYVPITSVELIQNATQVNELDENGKLAMYNITSLITTNIFPYNSNIGLNNVEYRITSGQDYVEIINNDSVRFKQAMPSGTFAFTISALPLEGKSFNILTFNVYVKASSLTINAPEYVMSKQQSEETVTVSVNLDMRATNKTTELIITDGSGFVKNISGNKITINKDLPVGKSIKVKAIHADKESEEIVISIYIPVETFDIVLVEEFKRGVDVKYEQVINGGKGATEIDKWQVIDSGIVDAEKFRNNQRLWVPQNTSAGTLITIYYQSLDKLGKHFNETFEVVRLKELNLFAPVYGYDGTTKINQNNPELWHGHSTNIGLTYNTFSLEAYGLNDPQIKSVTGQGSFIKNTTTISVNEGANGKGLITYVMSVRDGNYLYETTSWTIRIFNPLDSSSMSLNNYMADTNLPLNISGFENKTLSLADFTNNSANTNGIAVEGTGFSISGTSEKILTNTYAGSENPAVVLRWQETYNGTLQPFGQVRLPITLKRVSLDNKGGTGGQVSVVAVGYYGKTVSKPSLTGFIFRGYYTEKDGKGTQYYNENCSLMVTHSQRTETLLHAWMDPIVYTVKITAVYWGKVQIGTDLPGAGDPIGVGKPIYSEGYFHIQDILTVTLKYNESYSVTAPTISGYTFKNWKGTRIEGITSGTVTLTGLSSNSGASLTINAEYSKNSSGSCVAEGTLITLADGSQKAVEELDGTESLLVWNLSTGLFDYAPILFIDNEPEMEYEIVHLYFSDGTEVKVIDEHAFWDFDLNCYVFMRNDAAKYIGHFYNKQITNLDGSLSWTRVQLIDVQVYTEINSAWSPVTFEHLCFYVNGLLSMPGATEGLINIFDVDSETMRYDQDKFFQDIETYGLFTYEDDFAHLVPIEIYYAFNAQYLKVSIGKGNLTEEQLITLIERYSAFFMESV